MREEEALAMHDKIRSQIWDDGLHAFASAFIYTSKREQLSNLLALIEFLGIVIPIITGAVLAVILSGENWANWAAAFLSVAAVVQLIFSVLAVTSRWADSVAYFTESVMDHTAIKERLFQLGKFPPKKLSLLKEQYSAIAERRSSREGQDSKYTISGAEERAGMRAALREHRRKCVSCDKVPMDMDATECPVCGKFKISSWLATKKYQPS